MKKIQHPHDLSRTDRPLRWMMRAVGFSLTSASVFLLARHIPTARSTELIIGAGAALGAVTFASSWLTDRKKTPETEDAPLFV
ncbi:hypothetical protein [Rhodocaloribacter sp.]